MQGEHLNIMCQVQSVYYSLGKQTSKEKQFETAAFFFFPLALLISFPSKGLTGRGFHLALEGGCRLRLQDLTSPVCW